MKKYLLPIFLLTLFLITPTIFGQVKAANFSLSPSSATIDSNGKTVNIQIDAGSESLDSATAVITYDSSKATVTSSAGSFFPIVNNDDSSTSELVITGNVNFGDQIGKTGSGTFAILTITPKISSGTINIAFRCSASDADDSNILTVGGTNLLASNEQCNVLDSGVYTINAGSSESNENTSAPPSNNTSQPAQPEVLPQAGTANFMKWLIVSGFTLIGIGFLIIGSKNDLFHTATIPDDDNN